MRTFLRAALFVSCCTTLAFAENKTLYREGEPPLSAPKEHLDGQFPHFSDLVKDLAKAVVNVSVEGGTARPEQGDESASPKKEQDHPFRSLGSGFIISESGLIVTNNHVIENSDRIIVRLLDDKTEYEAKLIGRDPKTDVALIKIEPKDKLPVVYFGDSDAIEVGEWVIAIGNQFQLGQTVTAGIVSAKARKLPNQLVGPYDSFIQTDASINPGSSGGPLFNTKGQVIGINTAIYSPGRQQFGGAGFNIGIGFSVPINLAKGIISQLEERGKVTRGVLGVLIQAVDGDVAKALALKDPTGALVADVVKDSPASKAGFRRRDVIVKFNGKPVDDHDDLPLMVASTEIGTTVNIEVLRGGNPLTLKATIEELKDPVSEKPKAKAKPNSVGLVLEQLTEDEAKTLGIGFQPGLVVRQVEQDSDAERAGLIRGDVIIEFAGAAVVDIDSFEASLKKLQKGTPVLVLVARKEGTRFLTLKTR
ncbi:MAG: Do family serine endopeptidase [Oligoflexia bacterium]|nr:Do family serine endopeptidase [Oligoflexia bacterium]